MAIVQARDDITLFCDICFFDVSYRFFVLNSNPMRASLKSLSISVDSRSKVNLNVKYDEARNKCNTSFSSHFDRAIHF